MRSQRPRTRSRPGVELAPGGSFSKHTHPGEEIIYVLEGSLEYQVEGKAPVILKAGDVLFIPAGTIHVAMNVGSGNGGGTRHLSRRKREAARHIRQIIAEHAS